MKKRKATDREMIRMMGQLVKTFGGVRGDDFDVNSIRDLYVRKEYTECISVIKNFMGIQTKIRVAYVNNGGGKRIVWITLPKDLHSLLDRHGVSCLNRVNITIHIRKSFFSTDPSVETFVASIAHELAHLVLIAQGHPLRSSEVATDLVAAMYGFSQIMYIGRKHRFGYSIAGARVAHCVTWGYLTDTQAFATHLLISRLQVEQELCC